MKTLIFSILLTSLISFNSNAQQYIWQQRSSLGTAGFHGSIGFSIGNKAYFGCGQDNNQVTNNNIWEYNPLSDSWIQKASIPGSPRIGSACFAINGYGYVTSGLTSIGGSFLTETWKYDPANNTWIQAAAFPANGRYTASAFVIDNKAYVGTGYAPYYNDFYMYDPITDSWAIKASYPIPVQSCASFDLNGKGYLVGGNNNSMHNNVYEYDPNFNLWTQKNNFPVNIAGAFAFKINDIVFVGMGITMITAPFTPTSNVYKYDPLMDSWLYVSTFPSTARSTSASAVIEGAGYLFGGGNQTSGSINTFNELWKFIPDIAAVDEHLTSEYTISFDDYSQTLSVNGIKGESNLHIYDLNGNLVHSSVILPGNSQQKVNNLPSSAVYIYSIFNSSEKLTGKLFINR